MAPTWLPHGGPGAAARWSALLKRGGIVALPFETSSSGETALRLLALDETEEPPLEIVRRER